MRYDLLRNVVIATLYVGIGVGSTFGLMKYFGYTRIPPSIERVDVTGDGLDDLVIEDPRSKEVIVMIGQRSGQFIESKMFHHNGELKFSTNQGVYDSSGGFTRRHDLK